jgi:hypothetical protein
MTVDQYTGSDVYWDDVKKAAKAFKAVSLTGEKNGVRVIDAEAQTGSRYQVMSVVPDNSEQWTVLGTGMVVVVRYPWQFVLWEDPSPLITLAWMRHVIVRETDRRNVHGGDLVALAKAISMVTDVPFEETW